MNELIPASPAPGGEFLFYQTADGRTRLQVRVQDETVWQSLNQMADLFQRDKSVISRHISNVFEEGELLREATVANSATVQIEGGKQVTREIEFYNLDVIIPDRSSPPWWTWSPRSRGRPSAIRRAAPVVSCSRRMINRARHHMRNSDF